jgi:hypothetical protein
MDDRPTEEMLMRLTELDPHWWAEIGRHGQGITFKCPHCDARLAPAFSNPLDGGEPAPDPNNSKPRPHWKRSGDTFDTLTLSPSINYPGHWHGFIIDGEVRNA